MIHYGLEGRLSWVKDWRAQWYIDLRKKRGWTGLLVVIGTLAFLAVGTGAFMVAMDSTELFDSTQGWGLALTGMVLTFVTGYTLAGRWVDEGDH